MVSNQSWNEEHVQPRKRGGGMHQLKEADMMSAKLDLIMKKLEERDIEKKEVMHINDSHMTCEEWRRWTFRKQLSDNSRRCELHHQQQQLSSSTKSRMESATTKAKLPR
jgi:hypothetical protein